MSDPNALPLIESPEEVSTIPADTVELPEEVLEEVAGGIIDGGCIPDFPPTFPWEKTYTF